MKSFPYLKTIFLTFICVTSLQFCKDDEYDWSSIEAGKQKISRADADTSKIKLDSLKGDMITIKNYVAIARGGSNYQWVASNDFLKLTENASDPFKISVKADSKIDTSAWLWVQETTKGNKKGEPDSFKIKIFSYCSYNIDELLGSGSFSSKMTNYAPYPVNLTKIAGDTIINDNFFNVKWQVKYVLSKDTEEKVTIAPNQRFIYNQEVVDVKGSGTYNTCKGRLEIKYAVVRRGGDTIDFGSGIEILLRK